MGAHRTLLLTIRELPETMRPAAVERHEGVTVIACHRAAMRMETVAAMTDLLTTDELNALRAAYGQPPVGEACPEWVTADAPIMHWVPASLRVCGEPGVQGLDLSWVEEFEYERWAMSLANRDLLESA